MRHPVGGAAWNAGRSAKTEAGIRGWEAGKQKISNRNRWPANPRAGKPETGKPAKAETTPSAEQPLEFQNCEGFIAAIRFGDGV